MAHTSAVFSGYFHGRIIRDHQFPAIPAHMIVDTGAQGIQQGALPGVAPAGNHGDALPEHHPPYACHLCLILRRRHKRHRLFHGQIASFCPGQYTSVRHKGTIFIVPQPRPDSLLLFIKGQGPRQSLPVKFRHKAFHCLRKVCGQHLCRLLMLFFRQLYLDHNTGTQICRNASLPFNGLNHTRLSGGIGRMPLVPHSVNGFNGIFANKSVVFLCHYIGRNDIPHQNLIVGLVNIIMSVFLVCPLPVVIGFIQCPDIGNK